jgi:hypothetical protein
MSITFTNARTPILFVNLALIHFYTTATAKLYNEDHTEIPILILIPYSGNVSISD